MSVRGKSIVVIFATIVLSLSSGAPVFAQISCKAVKFGEPNYREKNR